MFVYFCSEVENNKMNTVSSSSEFIKFYGEAVYKKILKGSNFSEDDFNNLLIQKDVWSLFVKFELVVWGKIKKICGIRLCIDYMSKNVFMNDVDSQKVLGNIDEIARMQRCDIIQFLLSPKEFEKIQLCGGYYSTNYQLIKKYDGPVKKYMVSNDEYQISNISINEIPNMVRNELYTRLSYPGSTYYQQDRFRIIEGEYKALLKFCDSSNIKIKFTQLKIIKSNSYAYWLEDYNTSSTMIFHIWVPREQRGKAEGVKLLSILDNYLSMKKIISCSTIVAAQNISSLKTFLKSNYTVGKLLINKDV